MLLHAWAKKFATDSNATWGLRGYHIEALIVAPAALILLTVIALIYDPLAVKAAFTAVVGMSPVWVPIYLASFFWTSWIDYIRFMFWFSQKMMLLEITLPPEVEKSPLAMELFLSTLWNSGGESTFIARIWKGNYRAIWSLEIASNEGRLSFYIHTRRTWKQIIEARIYGQYPEAKIEEVEDYARKVPFNLEEYELWGCEFAKGAPGPVPIKTYTDYALDKNPDTPEIQVDPISNVLEYMSQMGKDEYAWLQIIIKARKKDEWYGFYLGRDHYKEEAKEEVQRMIKEAAGRSKELLHELHIADPEGTALKQAASRGGALLTDGERKRVEAIERSTSKLLFEAGIRGLYIAKKNRFNPINIGSMAKIFDPYRDVGLNGLNPARGMAIFDYPWQDIANVRHNHIKKQLFFHYRNRAYFYVPYDQVPVFLTTEELASLWHFPNSRVQPPGLERVAAKRAEAPVGLPTGQINLPS